MNRTFENQESLFDHLASDGKLYEYDAASVARLRELVGEPGRLLDVACGDGSLTAAIGSDAPCGLELSFACTRLARQAGVRAVKGDAGNRFPFADESFDSVTVLDAMHHLDTGIWNSIVAEARRVLVLGGQLVIVEPDNRNPFVRWTQAPWSPIRVAPWEDEPAVDPDELAAVFESCGLEPEVRPFSVHGDQLIRDVFPFWQRALKAPFVLALAWWCRSKPNKFAIVARKK